MYVYGPVTSSGEKTASAQICAMSGCFFGVDISAPTTGVATVKVYDSENSTTSGKLLLGIFTCAAGQNGLNFATGVPKVCCRGIYAELSGAAASYIVGYSV